MYTKSGSLSLQNPNPLEVRQALDLVVVNQHAEVLPRAIVARFGVRIETQERLGEELEIWAQWMEEATPRSENSSQDTLMAVSEDPEREECGCTGPHCACCGCCEHRPCPGGCLWATPDICSQCLQ